MNPGIGKSLKDVLITIKRVETIVNAIADFSSVQKDITDVVERKLLLLGSFMKDIDRKYPTLKISGKGKFISLNYMLIHNHSAIENDEIWNVCKKDLPILRQEIELLLNP